MFLSVFIYYIMSENNKQLNELDNSNNLIGLINTYWLQNKLDSLYEDVIIKQVLEKLFKGQLFLNTEEISKKIKEFLFFE